MLDWIDLFNCIKQMPYTNKNTSNTIEDKNTLKSRTYFHCGPQHKTPGQDETVTECMIINENLSVSASYRYTPTLNSHK